jgi:hypothetical protein
MRLEKEPVYQVGDLVELTEEDARERILIEYFNLDYSNGRTYIGVITKRIEGNGIGVTYRNHYHILWQGNDHKLNTNARRLWSCHSLTPVKI